MADTYDININVREQGAQQATRNINDLNGAANRAQGGLGGLQGAAGETSNGLRGAFSNALGQARSALSGFTSGLAESVPGLSQLGGLLEGAGAGGGVMAGGMATAAAGVLGLGAVVAGAMIALDGLGDEMGALADDASETADKLGVTTQELKRLQLVANENGGSAEGLVKIYDKLTKSLQKLDEDNAKTAEGFAKLGFTMDDMKDKTPEQALDLLFQRYEALGRSTEATAGMMQLIGPAFREQIPSLRALHDQVDELDARIKKYALQTPKEVEEAGTKMEIANSNLSMSWQSLKNEIAAYTANMRSSVNQWAADGLAAIGKYLKAFREGNAEVSRRNLDDTDENKAIKQGIRADEYNKARANPGVRSFVQIEEDIVKRIGEESNRQAQEKFRAGERATRQAGDELAVIEKQRASAKKKIEDDKQAEEDRKKALRDGESAARRAASEAASKAREAQREAARELAEASREQIRIDKERTAELQRQVDTMKRIGEEAVGRIAGTASAAVSQGSFQRRSVGLGSIDRDALASSDKIKADADAGRAKLDAAFANSDRFDFANIVQYNKQLDAMNEKEKESTLVLAEETQKRKDFQADWANGARNSIAEYIDNANNMAEQIGSLGTNLFKGMEDSLVSFVTTGKANFKEFAASILTQLARIAMAKAIAGIAGSLFGGASGNSADFGDAISSMFGGNIMAGGMANGGAFNSGIQFFADGGVVNRKTGFGMANGGMGVMGEAGPEAIMPLKRGADGKLGVALNGSGGGSGGNTTYSQVNQITIQSSGNADDDKRTADLVSAAIDKKFAENMAKANRPGGMNNRASLQF